MGYKIFWDVELQEIENIIWANKEEKPNYYKPEECFANRGKSFCAWE